MYTVPVVHQIQRYKEVAATVAATKPRVTGGVEVRYWSGVDRMAIPKGSWKSLGHKCCKLRLLCPYLFKKRSRVVLRQLTLFPSCHHLHGRLQLSSRGFAQAQGRCCGRRHCQEVCLSSWSLLTLSQITRKKKSKSKPKLDDVKERDRERAKELLSTEDIGSTPGSASGSNRASPSLSNGNERKTDAERRFEEAQRRRVSL